MRLTAPLSVVGWALGVFGDAKSFRTNPILGNARLNAWGLHRRRVAAAAVMTGFRRKRMRHIPDDVRADFDRDGLVVRENFFPKDVFKRIREEVLSVRHNAHEIRQGVTVTRIAPLSGGGSMPFTADTFQQPSLDRLLGYVAGRTGAPVRFIQTVMAEPVAGRSDPQTSFHSDTFHSNGKYWLFLDDVGMDDGPLVYVPGSHRLSPARLEWEYQQSLTARAEARPHHSDGSFRIAEAELANLGYGPPKPITVPANTLVAADTFGFHRRAPSSRPTIRVAVSAYLRRSPFPPWNGLHWQSLPSIRNQQMERYFQIMKLRGGKPLYTDVGAVELDSPPNI